MARKGLYKVSAIPNGWEIRKSRVSRSCWGAEVKSLSGWLNIKEQNCSGIEAHELYLIRPDRREYTVFWRVCLRCAARFHSDELEGDLTPWIIPPMSAEVFEEARKGTLSVLEDLNNMEG